MPALPTATSSSSMEELTSNQMLTLPSLAPMVFWQLLEVSLMLQSLQLNVKVSDFLFIGMYSSSASLSLVQA